MLPFKWYDSGPLEVRSHNPDISFHLDPAGTELMLPQLADVGALVCGRRLFDITSGWRDRHPMGAPVVVVPPRPPADPAGLPRTTFVEDVLRAIAVARELAGERDVVISSADIADQTLDLGLVDEVAVSLVPTLMSSGKATSVLLTQGPIMLEDHTVTVGTRATHLRYRVRR